VVAHAELSRAARRDVLDDLVDLAGLARSGCAQLERFGAQIAEARAYLPEAAACLTEGELRALVFRHERWARQLDELAGEARGWPAGDGLTQRLRERRDEHAALLRAQRGRIAAVITANDWQSPSYLHAGRSSAGRFTGEVVPHVSDYKRDRHHDAAVYEREYLRVHLPEPPCAVHAFMTACGMAAVTTVLAWLREEGALTGAVVAGRGVYHETRELLERALGRPPATVDETSAGSVGAAVERHAPSALFLDAMGNSSGMPVPDLDAVIRRLRATGRDTWLVVDNSGASPLSQPLARAPRRLGRLRILAVESLTKYAQLGIDRTTAGMITAAGAGCERLSEHRERLGTNVLDVSVHTLPWPDREALSRRLTRIERNATLLAERLNTACGPTARVSHPTLRHHHAFGRPLAFRGGYLTIDLCPDSRAGTEERFVRRAIAAAEAAGVPLAAGTSFGLDVTRVYAPRVAWSERARLLRVAAGTEDRLAIEAVAAALADAARELGRRPVRGRSPARPARPRGAARTVRN
jgi:cystathionine beta-lyase/cystathionine gamma-synthase